MSAKEIAEALRDAVLNKQRKEQKESELKIMLEHNTALEDECSVLKEQLAKVEGEAARAKRDLEKRTEELSKHRVEETATEKRLQAKTAVRKP